MQFLQFPGHEGKVDVFERVLESQMYRTGAGLGMGGEGREAQGLACNLGWMPSSVVAGRWHLPFGTA
jgi:hypothetical protein